MDVIHHDQKQRKDAIRGGKVARLFVINKERVCQTGDVMDDKQILRRTQLAALKTHHWRVLIVEESKGEKKEKKGENKGGVCESIYNPVTCLVVGYVATWQCPRPNI